MDGERWEMIGEKDLSQIKKLITGDRPTVMGGGVSLARLG